MRYTLLASVVNYALLHLSWRHRSWPFSGCLCPTCSQRTSARCRCPLRPQNPQEFHSDARAGPQTADLPAPGPPPADDAHGPPALEPATPGQQSTVDVAPVAGEVRTTHPSRDTVPVTPSSTSRVAASCTDSRSLAVSDVGSSRGPGGGTASTAGAAHSRHYLVGGATSGASPQSALTGAGAPAVRGSGGDSEPLPTTPASASGTSAGDRSVASVVPAETASHALPQLTGSPGSEGAGVGGAVPGAVAAVGAARGGAQPQEPPAPAPPTGQPAGASAGTAAVASGVTGLAAVPNAPPVSSRPDVSSRVPGSSQREGTSTGGVGEGAQGAGDTAAGPEHGGQDVLEDLLGSAVRGAGLLNPAVATGSHSASPGSSVAVDVGLAPGSAAHSGGRRGAGVAGSERGAGGSTATVPAMLGGVAEAASGREPGPATAAHGTGPASELKRLASAADNVAVLGLVPHASLLQSGGCTGETAAVVTEPSLRPEGARRRGLPYA